MVVERLGGLEPLKNVQNTQKTRNREIDSSKADAIVVSDEAKKMAEAYYLTEIAASTPDVRAAKIEEIKEKIKDPSYINSAVVNIVADRIMDSFGI